MTMKRLAQLLVFAIVLVFCASSSGAQYSGRVFKLGVLSLGSAEDQQNRLTLLREPLRDLGYEEGKNLVVESRFANSDYERLPVLASELARLKIDLFVAAGGTGVARSEREGREYPNRCSQL
jgi:putative tryptophan/tyrosine transport system substrate-binding protein